MNVLHSKCRKKNVGWRFRCETTWPSFELWGNQAWIERFAQSSRGIQLNQLQKLNHVLSNVLRLKLSLDLRNVVFFLKLNPGFVLHWGQSVLPRSQFF